MLASTTYAQNYRFDYFAINAKGQPLVNATVTICTSAAPANQVPCTPLANIYADAAGTIPLGNPLSSAGLGNFGFYAPPGTYVYTISGVGVTPTGPLPLTLPCVVGAGAPCGAGSGGGAPAPPVNSIQKYGTSTSFAASSMIDDNIAPVQANDGVSDMLNGFWSQYTNTGTGTGNHLMACRTNGQLAQTCSAGATSGAIGVAGVGFGTTGLVHVCKLGHCFVLFDNQSVPGDWAILSATVPGELHDTGSTAETAGVQNFYVEGANTGAGTGANISFLSPDTVGNGSGSGCNVMTAQYDMVIGGVVVGGFAPCTRLPAPISVQSVPQVLTSIPGAGVPGIETWLPAGVVPTTISAATDTVLATDRTACKYYNVAAGAAEAVTLPQDNSTGFGLNFVTCIKDIGLGKVTITPTTSTIDGAATLVLWPGDSTTIYSNNTDYSTRTTRTTRICSLTIGVDNGSALANADLGPQGRICPVPENATIVEVVVAADTGTPNVIVGRNRAGSIVNVTSAALATAAAGAIACSNANGVAGRDGTTCTNTLQNTAMLSGDWLELVSGTAGGAAHRMSVDVYFTSGR